MSSTTPNLALTKWDSPSDLFSSAELAANWDAVDAHDHASNGGVQVPAGGIANLAIGSAQLQDASIITSKLANLGVTTAKINDGGVTRAKLDPAAIKTVRSTGIVVTATTRATGTLTWATAFASTNYTVLVTPFAGLIGSGIEAVSVKVTAKTTTTIDYVIYNHHASVTTTVTLQAFGIAD